MITRDKAERNNKIGLVCPFPCFETLSLEFLVVKTLVDLSLRQKPEFKMAVIDDENDLQPELIISQSQVSLQ